MLSLNRKTDYALVALAYLGRMHQAEQMSAALPTQASARQIADLFQLPLPLLMNVLKELCQAGVVRSTRGVHGGYSLVVDPRSLTLLQVVEIMEGPVRLAACCGELTEDELDRPEKPEGAVDFGGVSIPIAAPRTEAVAEPCTRLAACPVREPIRRLHDRLRQVLATTTLYDLLEDGCACRQTPPVTIRVEPACNHRSLGVRA